MEQTILYVDKLFDNDCIGMTDNPKTIAYNNSKISKEGVDKFTDVLNDLNHASMIGCTGRYMFSIEMSLETKTYHMVFVDVKQDKKYAEYIASNLAQQDSKELFMQTFFEQEKIYKENYDSVKLVEGTPPLS